MRRWIIAVMVLVLAGVAFGDAIDEAEAKRRGVVVEVVQLEHARERIAALEKRIQELEAGKKPLAQPTTLPKKADAGKKSRDNLPEHIKAYLEYRDKQFMLTISNLRRLIASSDGAHVQHRREYQNRVEKLLREGTSKYTPTLALAYLIGPDDPIGIKVGDGGIISEEFNSSIEPRIQQIQNDTSALVTVRSTAYLIKGMSFKGMADGAIIKLDKPLICTQSATYITTMGAKRTVMQLEVFNPADYQNY